MKDFLQDLNESQREAVVYVDGPSLVVAGAGSGKTRVLTYKIAYLLKLGLPPYSILALTFTNKAAREMRTRIGQLIDYNTAKRLWVGTFHSVFSRILRAEAEYIGFKSTFTIYDTSDSRALLKAIIKEMKLDDKVYKVSNVHSRISYAKNALLTPNLYANNTELVKNDAFAKMPLLKDIYKIYWNRCFTSGAMDFDDLLLYTNILFRDNPQVLEKYQEIFQFVLVDEYQDTNFAQHLIIKRIAEKHQRICVVGDDAQSIYSFRGANIENILGFKDTTYPQSKIFKLEQNYRSTQNIVDAANSLIQKNKEQIRKNVFSEKEKGNPIKVFNTFSDKEEAAIVAAEILSLKKKYAFSDFAILYRTNAQSRVFEEIFRKSNIPYKIYGGLSFYQRKEIKDVLAYFRLAINQYDEEALKRIINYPARGIGDTTIGKITDCARLHNVTMWDVILDPIKYNLAINGGTAKKLKIFSDAILYFAVQVQEKDAYEVADEIVKKSGIWADINADKSTENLARQDNIQELLSAIHEFCSSTLEAEGDDANVSLTAFLSEVSLLTDQDNKKEEDTNKVTLMTVHASKGLEFKNVFVVGLEEELFPSARTIMSEKDLEEERRLFYVAITRAEENCFISYAKTRFRNGQSNFCRPSRFLKDIDESFLDLPNDFKWENNNNNNYSNSFNFNYQQENEDFSNFVSPKSNSYSSKKLTKIDDLKRNENSNDVSADNDELKAGMKIRHERFGEGEVISVEKDDTGNRKAWVDFGNNQKRQLLLKFAKYTIISEK
ncbi:exodeoxyribonuclease V subunit gamma [Bacteroidales bacterium OttesenSCG-928-I21]|nr:exodeoxyribonuclease V subunit gamma [Bacteroidales bacterium OttesenSCG-928-I21]